MAQTFDDIQSLFQGARPAGKPKPSDYRDALQQADTALYGEGDTSSEQRALNTPTKTGGKAKTKAGGKTTDWTTLVKQVGLKRASEEAPELDPRYQALVKTEGKQKAGETYAKQVLDPETERPGPGINPLAQGKDSALTQGEIALEQSKNPLEVGVGQLAQTFDLTDAAGLAGKNFKSPQQIAAEHHHHHPAPGPKPPTEPAKTSFAEQLMNGLLNQYASAMATVAPYISGQVSQQAMNAVDSVGGPTGPEPGIAAGINAKLAGDAKNVNNAVQAGARAVAPALQNLGMATDEYLRSSPWAGVLNAAMSGSQYNIERGQLPSWLTKTSTPAYITDALTASGAASGAAGVTPAGSNVPLPASSGTPTSSTITTAGAGNG